MTDAAPQVRFTPTQLRIVQLLADGKPHSRKEIHELLWDETSDMTTIRYHISLARKSLALLGETIVCELNCGIWYRRIKVQELSGDFPSTKRGFPKAGG